MRVLIWKAILILAILISFSFVANAQSAPAITSLSPTSGAIGASVTITGTNFGSSQGNTVTFNGTTASTTSWSATSIVATVPAGATTGNVVVTVSGTASNGVSFTVVPAPSITSLSPTSGAIGAEVAVAGANFGATQGSGSVTFNGTVATPTSWSASTIAVPVPSGTTMGNVVVNASGVASNGVNFTVVPPPSISSLSVTSGVVGTSVTITGTNFGSTQGTGTVSFNGTDATLTSWSSTSIVTTVPIGASTGNVLVSASGVASNGTNFTVVEVLAITGVSPTSGVVGEVVTLTGTGFGATNWDGLAYNLGSFTGSSLVGGFGGRALAERINGVPSPAWSTKSDWAQRYNPSMGSFGTWLGTGPSPGSAGGSAAFGGAGSATAFRSACGCQ